MLSSYTFEKAMAPRGTACDTAPNGWHRVSNGICVHCKVDPYK